MRVSIDTTTGKMIEAASDSTAQTLMDNAVASGFSKAKVQIRENVTQAEVAALIAAINGPPPPSSMDRVIDALSAEGIIPPGKVAGIKARLG